MEDLVFDTMAARDAGPRAVGTHVFGAPKEMTVNIDFTGQRGSGSNLYYGYVFQLPKWGYKLKKVDEWIAVTPTFAEYYNITIEQKHKLEAAIKTGLTSAGQAVADYELISHDERRYREILDYFKQAKGGNGHVLRNMFVDRVDAFTDQYALIQLAKRWPTIISDFIRMDDEPGGIDDIMRSLDVSRAEANLLKTKNELFKEWKALFFPAVKERYSRIVTLKNARKKSVEQYRSWLKPYVAKYKMIREKEETRPQEFLSNPFMTPGFGQSQASAGIRLWIWRPFVPAEKGLAAATKFKKGGEKAKFIIDPYDKFVKKWQEHIEKRYGVRFTEKDVRKIIDAAVKSGEMDPNKLYYVFFDVRIQLNLTKTPPPQGGEVDNVMFIPLQTWVMSQNVLLAAILELNAREQAFEREINMLIGTKETEEEELKKIEEEFMEKKPEKMEGLKKFVDRMKWLGGGTRAVLDRIFYIFVRRGPYETNFEERITKMYFRSSGALFGQQLGHVLKLMQVD